MANLEVKAVSSFGDFSVCLEFMAGRVVVSVRGDVDLLTAPELGAVFDTVIGRGHRRVVLDLSDCDFIDASGLRVIAAAVSLLGLPPGTLTIRSPSAMVRRILYITGLAEVVAIEDPGLTGAPRSGPSDQATKVFGHIGRETTLGTSGVAIGTDGYHVAPHLRPAAGMSPSDLVDGALRLVVSLAKATVGGADGASVSLRRHGRLTTVAASDQTISDMDAVQYSTGEGPCVDASVEGRWFHIDSLDTETRWPAFTPRAQALGINAILSSPLMSGQRPVGALNIYSRNHAAFGPEQQELASALAGEASSILAAAGPDPSGGQLGGRLGGALQTRQVIAMAQGVIMERDGVGQDAAFSSLRRSSVESGRPLRERAEDVVASTRAPLPDCDQPTGGGQLDQATGGGEGV